jgi:hypothetical protein
MTRVVKMELCARFGHKHRLRYLRLGRSHFRNDENRSSSSPTLTLILSPRKRMVPRLRDQVRGRSKRLERFMRRLLARPVSSQREPSKISAKNETCSEAHRLEVTPESWLVAIARLIASHMHAQGRFVFVAIIFGPPESSRVRPN